MDVKPGYKQTEVGVIPEDWDVQPLSSLAEKIMVGIASAATHAYRDRGIVMFRNQNIKPGHLDDSDLLYLDEDYESTFKNKRLKSGDLLTARTGYPGTTSIVSERYEGAQSFTTLITRPKRTAIDSAYLCCFINSEGGQNYFDQNQIGGGQKNVNAGSLKKLPVPVPPTKSEQAAIAGALSDVDALIETLERLIGKKRQMKQGAMQELLTGKKRLPGFSGEWAPIRLGQMAPLQRGFDLPTSQLSAGPYPVVYSNGVLNYHSSFQVRGPGVVTGRSGTIGAVTFVEHDFWPHNTSLWVTSFKNNDPKFVFYLYSFIGLEQFATGSGVPTLNRNDVHVHPVHMPSTKAEQVAIAGVLTDIDADLAEVENKLLKTRQIKRGMMQELLTGRIRLV